jgi:bifunctional ADP-heptose synthase (sugar kinase/adenylyltransferase)
MVAHGRTLSSRDASLRYAESLDTRSKIIPLEAALELAVRLRRDGRKLLVVSGSFDVLLAGHARDLEKVRKGTGASIVVVVLTPPGVPLLSDRARAELVAALYMVDYVVTAGEGSLEKFFKNLPAEAILRQAADEGPTRLLMTHVHRRHNL